LEGRAPFYGATTDLEPAASHAALVPITVGVLAECSLTVSNIG